jgi:hypothetical protein
LEDKQAALLIARLGKDKLVYEAYRIRFAPEAKERTYCPDFLLPNGIVVETKGYWDSADRQKMKAVRAQWPDIDIRMVFSRSSTLITKGSATTYGDYCTKLGIKFADKCIPDAWLDEPMNATSKAALELAHKPVKSK